MTELLSSTAKLTLLDSVAGLDVSAELLAAMKAISFTSADAKKVGNYVYSPYGGAGITPESMWDATPILQVFDVSQNKLNLVNTVYISQIPDFFQICAGPTYTAVSRCNSFLTTVTDDIYGKIDIYKTDPLNQFTTPLFTVDLGSTAFPFLPVRAQALTCGGFSNDGRYVFYEFTNGAVTDPTLKTGIRYGLIDCKNGTIAVEGSVDDISTSPYVFNMLFQGASVVTPKNEKDGVYYLACMYYANSLAPTIVPNPTNNRLIVYKVNVKKGSSSKLSEVLLGKPGYALSVHPDLDRIAVVTLQSTLVGAPTILQVAANPVNITPANPASELRLYAFSNNTLVLRATTDLQAIGASVRFSPNGDMLATTSTLIQNECGMLSTYSFQKSKSLLFKQDSIQAGPFMYNLIWLDNCRIMVGSQLSANTKNYQLYNVSSTVNNHHCDC